MFDVTRVLVHQPLPAGRRVAIVGNSGGPGILAADACSSAGLDRSRTVAGDTHGPDRAARSARRRAQSGRPARERRAPTQYEQALRLVLADEAVDAVIVIYTDPMISEPAAIVEAVRRAASSTPDKTMLACFLARDLPPAIELVPHDEVDDSGEPRRACAGRCRCSPSRSRQRLRSGASPSLATWRRPPGRDGGPSPTGYDGAAVREVVRDVLNTHLRPNRSGHDRSGWLSPEQLRAAPRRSRDLDGASGRRRLGRRGRGWPRPPLGLPVAMKVIATDVLHKSDVGGVALGLATDRCGGERLRRRWRGGSPG